MSKYTENIARKKFGRSMGMDHLSGSAFMRKKTMGADGVTEYKSEIDALGGDRKKLREGKITREQWVARWPNEKAEVSTGIIGGITNVVKDAAKLAVAPVSLATGKKVELSTGIGQIAGDALKLGVAPIKQAVSSVTGKQTSMGLQTGVGKVVGAIQETGAKSLNSLVKGAADVLTGGYATKLANVVRKDEYKEKAFGYSEMTPTEYKTGIKGIDKVAQVLPAVSAAVGGVVGGIFAGNKALDVIKGNDKPAGNLMPETTVVGPNVLDYQLPIPGGDQPLQAAFKFETWHIFAIVAAVIVLVLVSKYAKR